MAENKLMEKILNWWLYTFMTKRFPDIPESPDVGKWYTVRIPGAKCSDGSQWEGYFKKGKENKLIVTFFGGGVSIDEYTAARPHTMPNGFYNPSVVEGQIVMANCEKRMGITGSTRKNPFRDWSVITIPYDNGDFHVGDGEMEYTSVDGEQKTMYYHGYRNYHTLMEYCIKFIGDVPEAMMITGGSAGGFGTALLARDVVSRFPKTQNVTVLVDSSLLVYEKWKEVMETKWLSPVQIREGIQGDNITLDALKALHQTYGERVKILFGCSVRDVALAQTQVYFDAGYLPENVTKEQADRFQAALKEMIEKMRGQIPGCGIYIWEKQVTGEAKVTPHTLTGVNLVFAKTDENDTTIGQWVEDAVNGKIKSYGLDLLEKNY